MDGSADALAGLNSHEFPFALDCLLMECGDLGGSLFMKKQHGRENPDAHCKDDDDKNAPLHHYIVD
jgi:hypothetical protein